MHRINTPTIPRPVPSTVNLRHLGTLRRRRQLRRPVANQITLRRHLGITPHHLNRAQLTRINIINSLTRSLLKRLTQNRLRQGTVTRHHLGHQVIRRPNVSRHTRRQLIRSHTTHLLTSTIPRQHISNYDSLLRITLSVRHHAPCSVQPVLNRIHNNRGPPPQIIVKTGYTSNRLLQRSRLRPICHRPSPTQNRHPTSHLRPRHHKNMVHRKHKRRALSPKPLHRPRTQTRTHPHAHSPRQPTNRHTHGHLGRPYDNPSRRSITKGSSIHHRRQTHHSHPFTLNSTNQRPTPRPTRHRNTYSPADTIRRHTYALINRGNVLTTLQRHRRPTTIHTNYSLPNTTLPNVNHTRQRPPANSIHSRQKQHRTTRQFGRRIRRPIRPRRHVISNSILLHLHQLRRQRTTTHNGNHIDRQSFS